MASVSSIFVWVCLIGFQPFFVLSLSVSKPKADIVILGAGAAGITAASELIKNGHNVKILEAERELGGRMRSVPVEGGSLELGAQVIWGQSGVLYDFLKAANLIDNGGGGPPVKVNLKETGGKYSPEDETKIAEINAKISQIILDIEKNPKAGGTTLSLGAQIKDAFDRYLATYSDKELAEAVYDTFVRTIKTEESTDSLYDVSPYEIADRRDGHIRVPLTVPYAKAIQQLASNVPESVYNFNRTVDKIIFSSSTESKHPLTITTNRGEVFKAHHVIVTASLGVLKRDEASLFVPPLPANKKDQIASAGFGTLGKIFIVYEAEFWKPIAENFNQMPFLWTSDLSTLDNERRYTGKHWTRTIDELKFMGPLPSSTRPGSSVYVVSTFFSGHLAEQSESLSDEQLVKDLTAILKNFTGLENIPQPLEVIRQKWHSSPNFRGSFSYIGNEFAQKGYNVTDLYKPLWDYDSKLTGAKVPALLFAGEAMDESYFGHVTGAVQSGHREGLRINSFYKDYVGNAVSRLTVSLCNIILVFVISSVIHNLVIWLP